MAAPAPAPQQTSNDLSKGCQPVIFVFARGSTEPGNMGYLVGPQTCTALKKGGGVACQGVGGAYTASIMDNVSTLGTTQAAINEAKKTFSNAAKKCPDAKIVFGGYSQGAAVMHGAVSSLEAGLKEKVVGGVLYGDTRNQEDKGQIPNYPKEAVKIFCRSDDGVCGAGLSVTAGHLAYGSDVNAAVQFLRQRIGK
ncbi:cutinase [Eremomyces bilateralis CBS 781.70]|uniref:Cutinase n=1 Tax=Eremomyces bilateralis CBS 781.70 TaxID=1392243 RepID=A0A6G1GF41_9PEZI|nr:cutinase [Eremomyces bilateralis CBS 781.70]KAF1816536.1 cutinase [Eremomyces bilateralis CBS 781.70]